MFQASSRDLLWARYRPMVIYAAFVFTLLLGVFFRFYAISDRMTHIDDIGPLDNLVTSNSQSDAAENVSNNWTYGPSQFRLSWFFIQGANHWSDLLMRARLPSAIFSSFGLCFLFAALWLIDGRLLKWSSVLVFSLCALSCHALIEAQQAYVYGSTQLAAGWIILGIALLYLLGESFRNWIAISTLLVLPATWFITISYQNIFLLPGMFIAIALSLLPFLKKKAVPGSRIAVLMALLAVSAWYVKRIYLFKLLPLKKAGYPSFPGWAREGSASLNENFGSNLIHGLQFEFQRLGNFFFYQLTPVWPSALSSYVIFGMQLILLTVAGFGAFQLLSDRLRHGDFDQKHRCKTALTIFSIVSIAIFAVLCTANVIPFGATRHSHILLATGVWLLKMGTESILERYCHKEVMVSVIPGAIWFVTVLVFFAYRSLFISSTENRYDVAFLDSVCRSQSIAKFYEVDWTWDYSIASQRFQDQYVCPHVDRVNQADVISILEKMARDPSNRSAMFSSHRFDLVTVIAKAEKNPALAGLRFQYLRNEAPTGSTEPIGNVNGGNGFYVVVVN